MKTKIAIVGLVTGLLCTVSHAQVFRPNIVQGAVAGSVVGAVIGNNFGGHNGAKGALVGGIVGALVSAPHQAAACPPPVVYSGPVAYTRAPQVVYRQVVVAPTQPTVWVAETYPVYPEAVIYPPVYQTVYPPVYGTAYPAPYVTYVPRGYHHGPVHYNPPHRSPPGPVHYNPPHRSPPQHRSYGGHGRR